MRQTGYRKKRGWIEMRGGRSLSCRILNILVRSPGGEIKRRLEKSRRIDRRNESEKAKSKSSVTDTFAFYLLLFYFFPWFC
ncbi:MAG: hypothetical protein AMS27_02455 [Bacteroides sp. SM23_62_1]|nr:MAG: hypothetical protein AMS27_02455 [Bacteroides sp. SM23_62_1]